MSEEILQKIHELTKRVGENHPPQRGFGTCRRPTADSAVDAPCQATPRAELLLATQDAESNAESVRSGGWLAALVESWERRADEVANDSTRSPTWKSGFRCAACECIGQLRAEMESAANDQALPQAGAQKAMKTLEMTPAPTVGQQRLVRRLGHDEVIRSGDITSHAGCSDLYPVVHTIGLTPRQAQAADWQIGPVFRPPNDKMRDRWEKTMNAEKTEQPDRGKPCPGWASVLERAATALRARMELVTERLQDSRLNPGVAAALEEGLQDDHAALIELQRVLRSPIAKLCEPPQEGSDVR